VYGFERDEHATASDPRRWDRQGSVAIPPIGGLWVHLWSRAHSVRFIRLLYQTGLRSLLNSAGSRRAAAYEGVFHSSTCSKFYELDYFLKQVESWQGNNPSSDMFQNQHCFV
jgi:hypothetical protein